MKARKIISILLVITMGLSMVACGSSKETNNNDGEKTTNDQKVSKDEGKSKEPVNLIWIQGGDQPKEHTETMKVLNEKSAEDIGVTVDLKYYDSEKTLLAMATGEYFDIAFTCGWFNNYALGAQKGFFADITEKVKESAPDLYKYIPEIVWKGSMVDNKVFAVPVYKDSAATQYWTFDEKLITDELGMDFSNVGYEMDSITPILKAFKENRPDEFPIMCLKDGLGGAVSVQYEPLDQGSWIGVAYEGNSTKVVSILEQPDVIKNLETMHEWFEAGYIWPDAPYSDNNGGYSAVSVGQGFVGADAIWSAANGYKVAAIKRFGPVYSTASIRGAMNGIGAISKNVDAALKYLQYANLDVDYRNMLAYGIEGKHYERNEEGTVEKLNDGFQPWTFSQATFFTMYPTSPAPVNQWELVKEDIQTAPGSALIGFTPNLAEIETEIAAATTIIQKYQAGLLTGYSDPGVEISKMMEELESVGYRDIINSIQEQVDEFLKK